MCRRSRQCPVVHYSELLPTVLGELPLARARKRCERLLRPATVEPGRPSARPPPSLFVPVGRIVAFLLRRLSPTTDLQVWQKINNRRAFFTSVTAIAFVTTFMVVVVVVVERLTHTTFNENLPHSARCHSYWWLSIRKKHSTVASTLKFAIRHDFG